MIEVIKNNDQVILIVEDEGALSGVLQNKLTRHGFVVEVASDGIEGLEKMKTLQPKLVLLDLIMPNKNGFQVLEEAKADQNTKNIAIVIFSVILGVSLGITKNQNSTVALAFFDAMFSAFLR